MSIYIPKNPTPANLTAAILQRFSQETEKVKNLSWTTAAARNSTQSAILDAYTSANDFLAAIQAATNNAVPSEQSVVGPFEQAWLNFLAAIIASGDSSQTRKSVLDSATSQVTTSWANIDSSIQSASGPNVATAVQNAIAQIQQVIDFTNDLGTIAINVPLKSHLRAVLNSDYPGKAWSDLTDEEQGNATVTALQQTGLTGVSEALEFLGRVSLGISVVLAFWNAANNANKFAATLSDSLLQIGAGYVGGNLAGDAFAASDASNIMGLVFGTEGDVVAALIPTGFGLVSGIVIALLVDVLFNLIFGTGTNIPASLQVAITIPITVPIS